MGYIGNDGSALVGGLNPSGVIQGVTVDAQGHLLSEDTLRAFILSGQSFTAFESGTSGAAHNFAISLYSPGTKNVFIYRGRGSLATGAGSMLQIWTKSSDFALGAISGGPFNRNAGSATASTCTLSGSTNAASSGTKTDECGEGLNGILEFLQNGTGLFIPAGTTAAYMLFLAQSASGYCSLSYDWVEF